MLVLRSVRRALPDRRRHGQHALSHSLKYIKFQDVS
jgi:hypothetical protein